MSPEGTLACYFCPVPFWIYMLRCADGTLYTGHTDDLERRVAQHQAGEIEGFTLKRRPLRLVFAEEFSTRAEALGREFQIKHWRHQKKVALMRGQWDRVSQLARGRG